MGKNQLLLLDNQLCFLLYACSRGITRIYRPLLEKLNITYPQYLVLLVLWEQDEQWVNAIGARLQLDSGTLTPLLKRLQKSGVIVRKRSVEDERKVIICLTEKGRRMKETACEIPEALICRSGLTAEQYGILKTELEKLMNQIQQYPATPQN